MDRSVAGTVVAVTARDAAERKAAAKRPASPKRGAAKRAATPKRATPRRDAAKRAVPKRDRRPLSRDLIARAGRAQVERVGLDGLSLREVARTLEVTPAALYAHVDGKAGIVAAIAEDAFAELAERFSGIEVADPVERIRAQAYVYVEYALESPQLYRVMMRFAPALPADGTAAVPAGAVEFDPATAVFTSAMGAVADAVRAGDLAIEDPLIGALVLWAAMHGLVETMSMGFGLPPDLVQALTEAVVETTIRGLVL